MKNEQKKNLITSIIGVLLALSIYKAFSFLVNGWKINEYLLMFIKELVFLAIVLLVAIKVKKLNVLKFKKEGIGTGLLLGWFIIIMAIFTSFMGIYASLLMDMMTATTVDIIMLIIDVIMVGIVEELSYRGIIQNGFNEYFGEATTKDVRKAIICTGIFFGLSHLLNVFVGAGLTGVLIQAIGNIPMGMLLGTIYYRSRKNLWVCIFLHALLDFGAFLQDGALMGVTASESISAYGVNMLVMPIIELAIVCFLLRKKKIEPLLEK